MCSLVICRLPDVGGPLAYCRVKRNVFKRTEMIAARDMWFLKIFIQVMLFIGVWLQRHCLPKKCRIFGKVTRTVPESYRHTKGDLRFSRTITDVRSASVMLLFEASQVILALSKWRGTRGTFKTL